MNERSMLMKDRVFDNMIKERIKGEGTEFPQKLNEEISSVIQGLPDSQVRASFWSRWNRLVLPGSLTAVLIVSVLIYIIGSSMPGYRNSGVVSGTAPNSTVSGGKAWNQPGGPDLTGLTAQLKSQGYNVEDNTENEENIQTGIALADFARGYFSIEDLVRDSDIIIEGQVLGTKYFDNNATTHTEAKVYVMKSYSSKVKQGEVLTYIDNGGITTQYNVIKGADMENKFTITSQELEAAKKQYVRRLINGAPYVQPGEKVFLFVREETGFYKSITGKQYCTVGAYQGKFIVHDGIAERYVSKDDILQTLSMSETEMDKKIKETVGSIQ
jgi:hypothetical protein